MGRADSDDGSVEAAAESPAGGQIFIGKWVKRLSERAGSGPITGRNVSQLLRILVAYEHFGTLFISGGGSWTGFFDTP
jgi:hypothetical protein